MPDLPDIEEPPVPLNDLWAQIRLRTAPWGTDVWDTLAPPTLPSSVGDTGSEREGTPSDASSVTTPSSVQSQPGYISGAPHQIAFAAGQVHLLAGWDWMPTLLTLVSTFLPR